MSLFAAPARWDANEWLIIGMAAAGWTFVYLKRHTFQKSLTILLLAAGSIIAMALDLLLSAPPLDLYDINDTRYVEWFDILLYAVYPPFGFLYLYFYKRLRINGMAALIYILAFSVISMSVEMLADIVGIFRFKGWKYTYSLPVYIISQGAYLLFYHWMRNILWKTKIRRPAG